MKYKPVFMITSWVILAGLALAGCVKPFGTPSAPLPAPTPVPTADVHIQGFAYSSSAAITFSADITANGAPVSTATVVLSGPGLNWNVPNFNNTSSYIGETSSGPFQAGQDYVISVGTSVGNFATTIACPGMPVIATDGSQVTWSPEGNRDRVQVFQQGIGNNYTFDSSNTSADVDSPFIIPTSAYPAAGIYEIFAWTLNVGGFSGADSTSQFSVGYNLFLQITK